MAKILVIEDDAGLRSAVVDWLSLSGFDVVEAHDGEVGIQLAYHHLPDLIVCDLMMPGLDGYAVMAELRAHPLTMKTPVVIFSAVSALFDERQRIDHGAVICLDKPFSMKKMLREIRQLLPYAP